MAADDAFRELEARGDETDGEVSSCWGGRVLSKENVMEQMGVWHVDGV